MEINAKLVLFVAIQTETSAVMDRYIFLHRS